MNRKLTTPAVVVGVMLAALTVFAARALTVDEIIERANKASYYAGKDGKSDVRMVISDPGGSQRIREFSILRMNTKDGGQKFYVYFKSPADVRKMAFLVWKNIDKEDQRWLWLPAHNLERRIAPGDKRTSFASSDFLYEDVSGRSPDADEHELVETTENHYMVKNTPKKPEEVEFAHYNVWIDKDTFLPLKAEYYDKDDKKYRRVKASRIEKVDGHPTVVEAVAENLEKGTSTTNFFSNIEYDMGLKESIFTKRFLSRPPREVR